jgi:hypothetical protein
MGERQMNLSLADDELIVLPDGTPLTDELAAETGQRMIDEAIRDID